MSRDAALTARLGFTGKLSAHPRHAQAIRQGFAPDADDVRAAQEMVTRGEAMVSEGSAPVFGVNGMEVTPPIIGQARLVLQRDAWAKTL
jgi:citrate lyase beta subunit